MAVGAGMAGRLAEPWIVDPAVQVQKADVVEFPLGGEAALGLAAEAAGGVVGAARLPRAATPPPRRQPAE
jgi:hypothetical protein